VFLKEGGVFCVDDGDIEMGLAVEGGVGEDYAVLLEVCLPIDETDLIRGTPVMMKMKILYVMTKMKTNTTQLRILMGNVGDHDLDLVHGRVQIPKVMMIN
jgi:hypothetical protein